MLDMSGPRQGAIEKLQSWRNQYSQQEYPEKVLINLFYDLYAMDGMWPQIETCFSGAQRFSDHNQALNHIIGLKRKYQAEVLRPRLLQMMNADQAVGNAKPSNWADRLNLAQAGDDASVIELEYSYWYYFQYQSATLSWAAAGLQGLDKRSAFIEVAGGEVGGLRLSSFSDALRFFPVILGIELEHKDIDGNRVEAASSGGKKVYPASFAMLPKLWGNQSAGVPTELKKLQAAAEQGNIEAKYVLGRHFAEGIGCPRNPAKGIPLIRSAAEAGNRDAQGFLGSLYMEGDGVPQNPSEGARWLRLAADQGDPFAQYNLGYLYERGIGVAANHPEAVRLYKLAAASGVVFAQFHLAQCYEHGKGVREDTAEAIRWYRLAAENGDTDAKEKLRMLEQQKKSGSLLSLIFGKGR
ncbi:Sel1 repeat-containing protein [Allochromatium warmingii]|uniref:Sel1 repeat-containing protein n=1 Tax=Allochromatium warmingii TaxID=61595 RepID=A0A1H3FYE5_ALLWA|nr:tetratricopeptide repeat protein [Allochromatium warmingii]SDX95996.1 Sel1 repeat-containing protein [Allochromatium warmingii]